VFSALEKRGELEAKGILTKEEFATKEAQLLSPAPRKGSPSRRDASTWGPDAARFVAEPVPLFPSGERSASQTLLVARAGVFAL
jgi:hypothetical protein